MAAFLSAIFGTGGSGSESSDAYAASSSQQQPRGPSWNLQRFTDLYTRLTNFRESDLERPGGGDAVVELVRQITEALVWGEQHDGSFFDFFCEKGIFSDFIRVLSLAKAPKTVKVQLLQTLSMLFQNIRRDTSLIYLLSNRQVNRLITTPLDFTDEEILAYYITLLKCLAMRLNDETVQFFFVADPEPSFPLYTGATQFFSHRDQMVRATVRTITLQVFPLAHEPMQRFVQAHAESRYFGDLALHLRDIWLRLNRAAIVTEDAAALQHEHDLQQDLLIYMSDVFNLGISSLNRIFADKLLHLALVPLLVASVEATGSPQQVATRSTQSARLAPKVAMFLLRQVFDTINHRMLVEPLATMLLHARAPEHLCTSLDSTSSREFRPHLVKYLRPGEDATFLFAVALVHSCVQNREALPAHFLEAARIFPRSSVDSQVPLINEQHLDIPWLLLQALQVHAAWRPESFHVLVSTVRDIFLDPVLLSGPECRSAALRLVGRALQAAGGHLEKLLHDQMGAAGAASDDDALLDAFMEEWELGRATPTSVADVCTAAWRWLLSPACISSARGRGVAAGTAERAGAAAPPLRHDAARRAVRAFLSLRKLQSELESPPRPLRVPAPPYPQAAAAAEPSPLQVDLPQADRLLREGAPVDLGIAERISCSQSSQSGPSAQPRCLILHERLLLLAQLDSPHPGMAKATTVWPLQQVHSLIDRGDPRVLRLGLQAFFGGGCPSEAAAFSPPVCIPDPAAQRRSSFFTLALHFEDVRMCHAADQHLTRHRRDVRRRLLRKTADFVQDSLQRASPK